MKVCSKCKVEKDESEFYKQKAAKDGLNYCCKHCLNYAIAEWKKNNPKKTKETSKRYRDKNHDKLLESQKKWRKNNPEKTNGCKKKYMENNLLKIREKRNIYNANHREEARARTKKWQQENPEKLKAKNQRVKENLYDSYVSMLLVQMGFPKDSITKDMIEFKRIQLKIKRLIKEKESA